MQFTSKRPLQIAFVSAKRFAFDPTDYLGHGVGGSESALILLTRELAQRGHFVEVYNYCPTPGSYAGVLWRPYREFDPTVPRDAVISLRLLEPMAKTIAAPIRGVWIHDSTLPGATQADREGHVNLWIAVSATQRASIERESAITEAHWFMSRNALDQRLYGLGAAAIVKVPGQAIYCSAPDRGLGHLLKLWPAIRALCPWASLVVTGSFALWGHADEENERFCEDIYRLAAHHPEVRLERRVPKEHLAVLQAQSEVMLYPTDFDEMFCISALECLALGVPVVATRRSALTERIDHGRTGFLIDGSPGEPSYHAAFVTAAARLLTDHEEREAFAERAATELSTYADVAIEWEQELLARLRGSE